jgi:predicted RNA-binding protein
LDSVRSELLLDAFREISKHVNKEVVDQDAFSEKLNAFNENIEALERELEDLRHFKSESDRVYGSLPWQEIGEVFDLQIGDSIGVNILPGLQTLKTRCQEFAPKVLAHDALEVIVKTRGHLSIVMKPNDEFMISSLYQTDVNRHFIYGSGTDFMKALEDMMKEKV